MSVALLLDEMFSPAVAVALRARGHDVVAVAAEAELRALTDADVLTRTWRRQRWIATENVRDFQPLWRAAVAESTPAGCGVLFTSSRSFPRSRRNPGPVIEALHDWLTRDAHHPGEWLARADPGG